MVVQHGDEYTRGRSDHTHPATVGLAATVELYTDVRRKATNDLFAPASALVTEALRDVDIIGIPHDNRPQPNTMVTDSQMYCRFSQTNFTLCHLH
jgi:hypothetical protein